MFPHASRYRGDKFTLRCFSPPVIPTNPVISTGINKATDVLQQASYRLADSVPLSAQTPSCRVFAVAKQDQIEINSPISLVTYLSLI